MCLCKVQIACVVFGRALSVSKKNTRTAISARVTSRCIRRSDRRSGNFSLRFVVPRAEKYRRTGLISFKFPRLRGIADRARFSRPVLTLERFGDETRFVRLYPRERSAARGCMRVCASVLCTCVCVRVHESGVVPGEVTDARRAA